MGKIKIDEELKFTEEVEEVQDGQYLTMTGCTYDLGSDEATQFLAGYATTGYLTTTTNVDSIAASVGYDTHSNIYYEPPVPDVIIKSPNGLKFKLVVDEYGTLSTVAYD